MGAFVFPTILHGQIDTLLALPESKVSANPNVASARLKSDYFLAESKFQEEAFHESQQLFQKLIDSTQKNLSINGSASFKQRCPVYFGCVFPTFAIVGQRLFHLFSGEYKCRDKFWERRCFE